jgi:hypothetical protein
MPSSASRVPVARGCLWESEACGPAGDDVAGACLHMRSDVDMFYCQAAILRLVLIAQVGEAVKRSHATLYAVHATAATPQGPVLVPMHVSGGGRRMLCAPFLVRPADATVVLGKRNLPYWTCHLCVCA